MNPLPITSYEEIPTNLANHILDKADAGHITEIPLEAINYFVNNMSVDTFFKVMESR